jgi:hypothetical protein
MVCAFQVEETVMMEYHQDFNPRLPPTFSFYQITFAIDGSTDSKLTQNG